MSAVSIADRADWLRDERLQRLLACLSQDGEEARVAGGALRNTLLGEAVTDIDIATTTEPAETVRRAEAAGFRTVPTGWEHGTVTAIAEGAAFEVTSLRADVETFGRHARVVFGRDWAHDAQRRDFTINALYARANGELVDLVGGLDDIAQRRLRFIGEPESRIREDYLRILRFFRFFAWYGEGRPDAAGLKACAKLKAGLAGLSAERVWAELKKLLCAPDPRRALLWMRQTSVLAAVLPESEKWGIDAVAGLVEAEGALALAPDPILRLQAVVPPVPERMEKLARRLKFSKAETTRLVQWALAAPVPHDEGEDAFSLRLYRGDRQATQDRLLLALAAARQRAEDDAAALAQAAGYLRLLRLARGWRRPHFPLGGGDLETLGLKPGKPLGDMLRALEAQWAEDGFRQTRGALLERAAQMLEKRDG